MSAANVVGVNYSNTFQSSPINDTDAAKQIQALGATSVKLFNYTQTGFLDQARANRFSVLVDVPNAGLEDLYNNNTSELVNAIASYTDVIETVCIGNEPLGSWQPEIYKTYLPKAVSNAYAAFQKQRLNVRITVPFNYAIMGNSWPPSSGTFDTELVDTIEAVCAVLGQSGSPFMVNVYPYLDHINNLKDVPVDYCLFTKSSPQFRDPVWDLDYYNIFDASYDALIQALSRIGHGTLPVVIGECGWPTGGGRDASVDNAKVFIPNLITHCNRGAGSPKHPNIQIPCYLFEMYDEDQKSATPGPFETHWGLYHNDEGTGTAKYAVSLGGRRVTSKEAR